MMFPCWRLPILSANWKYGTALYSPFFFLLHDKAEITPRWIMYFFRALPLIATRTVSRMPPSSILQSVVHVAQLRGELRRNFCLPIPRLVDYASSCAFDFVVKTFTLKDSSRNRHMPLSQLLLLYLLPRYTSIVI